jgi:2-C-methyl-D-erythritol 4-phosphate cytidylyltransferase
VHVTAVVVADDAGIDPLTWIAGVPMVVRSVRGVLASGVVDRVMIDARERVLRACAGLPVHAWEPHHASARIRAHAGQRADGTSGDDVLLVHDAARPLTPPALFTAALAAVLAGADAVVPVLPLPDTVKLVDGAGVVLGTPDRAGLRVVQTPCAFRAAVWDARSAPLAQPASLVAQTIPGDPLAFPVRTAWDLELAGLLAEA